MALAYLLQFLDGPPTSASFVTRQNYESSDVNLLEGDLEFGYNMRSFEAEEAAGAASAYSIEGHLWKHIGRDDLSNGVVQEVVGSSVKKARFNIMVFWAAPAIQKKFPAHFRVLKQVFAAINHEAIVEGIFSTAGRNFSKSRADIGSQQFCEGIECASGEKRGRTDANEIQAAYKQLKRDRLRN